MFISTSIFGNLMPELFPLESEFSEGAGGLQDLFKSRIWWKFLRGLLEDMLRIGSANIIHQPTG